MWWDGPGWGFMYGGWWLMPLFGLTCMIIFLYAVSRIFGRGGGFCSMHDHQGKQADTDELRREIRQLHDEIKSLQENKEQKEDT